MKNVKMGVIGLGQRGSCLIETILAFDHVDIIGVCDLYEDRRIAGAEKVKTTRGNEPIQYADYKELIRNEEIDAVLVASSWDEHIHMAIDCMRAGKITAMEVGGAYDVEECWELVRAHEETGVPIMMMENCCFDRFELLGLALARAGKFGEIVHCHGAYSHDLRDEILGGHVRRHYRLENYMFRNCENYPTHELGPIAKVIDINRGNKMVSLVSMASKSSGLADFAKREENPDKSLTNATFKQGDIVTTIISCANGETITLTLDTTLPKYYSREFTLRGTKGLCLQDANMVYIEGDQPAHEFFEPQAHLQKYLNNAEEYVDYVPNMWKNITPRQRELGHGGMDYLMFKAFFNSIENGTEMIVDVYDAAAWMCVTALSERSIAQGGAPQFVPDFTRGKWLTRPRLDVEDLE